MSAAAPTEHRFVVLVEFLRDTDGFRRLDDRDARYDFSEVAVLASSEVEAQLIACEIVACRPGIQITRSLLSC